MHSAHSELAGIGKLQLQLLLKARSLWLLQRTNNIYYWCPI
jgi:hypothetical protein